MGKVHGSQGSRHQQVSDASLRYRLDQVFGHDRNNEFGDTIVSLFLANMIRNAPRIPNGFQVANFTEQVGRENMRLLGSMVGRTISHELGHNFGMLDQYGVQGARVADINDPPLEGPGPTAVLAPRQLQL